MYIQLFIYIYIYVNLGYGDAILFNGVGMCTGSETGCNDQDRKMYVDVKPNKVYRLRILNAASFSYYNMAISDHNMTVIKAASTLTKQNILNSLDINCGDRYDVLVTTSAAVASYRIQIQSNWGGSEGAASDLNNMNFFLRYNESPVIAALNAKNESKPWNQQSSEIVMPVLTDIVATVAEPTKTLTINIQEVKELDLDECLNIY
jgi:FtsP/CotA-like multicopper oxidase with cupredoxin domain